MSIKKVICDKLEDNEIVRRSLKDVEYFSCLYDRYESRLKRYIKKISFANEEEAEDILQDSFIKIWRNLNQFDESLKLSSWLYRIVHNETISYQRKKRSYGKNHIVPLEENLLNDFYSEIELDITTDDTHKLTLGVINSMPLKYKECIILKYFEMMSYEEISDILKIPEGTVAVRINRAKKMFKKIAEKEHISFKY
jgi:RNA polymerase sigma-70 factor (ECF subfamily)